MQTILPDLPFINYGNAVINPASHSSTKGASRTGTFPRTDLKGFTPWNSFPDDIHQAIQAATNRANLPSTPFAIERMWSRPRFVECEEALRAHATFALHAPVEEVVEMFGVEGSFMFPGGGNTTIGDPDFSWAVRSDAHWPRPKLVVEYKVWWEADLVDLPASFQGAGARNDILSRQSLDALEQIYGYMIFNNNRFGILSNWYRAWFLRRSETSDGKTLEYFVVELDGPQHPPISMLKAWVGMVLLAENDWFYASPTFSNPPVSRSFLETKAAWKEWRRTTRNVNGEYPCLTLDFRLCFFDLSSARRGGYGCVVNARFLQPSGQNGDLDVVCKFVDVVRYPDAKDLLKGETHAYAALRNLQGQVIPTLYGFYEVWGILQLLVLEPVGDAIPDDELITVILRKKMKATLQRIHDAGYVHGDIAHRNFCRAPSHDVFLVDLERCRPAENQSELDNEMKEVDRL